jgi:glycerophosphoryl diester phosphodiesterase
LDILPAGARLNLEIKNDNNLYPGIEKKILNMLNAYGPPLKERIIISSFDYAALQRVRALDAGLKIGVLQRRYNLRQLLDIAACSLHMSKERITRRHILQAHENNLKVFVYTVNQPAEAANLKAMGADGIFTDYPDIRF